MIVHYFEAMAMVPKATPTRGHLSLEDHHRTAWQLFSHGKSAVADLFQDFHPRESDVLFGKNAFSNTRNFIALSNGAPIMFVLREMGLSE